MATLITSVTDFKAVGRREISYASRGTSTTMAMNVRYSAQRRPRHSPDRLHALQQGVGGDDHTRDDEVTGADGEEPGELVFDAARSAVYGPADTALQIGDDAHEIPLQQRLVGREDEDRRGQHAQYEKVQ